MLEQITPFIPVVLFLLLVGSSFLWVRGHIKRQDENQAEWAAWAIGVTNKVNQLQVLHSARILSPPMANMAQFIAGADRALADEEHTNEE